MKSIQNKDRETHPRPLVPRVPHTSVHLDNRIQIQYSMTHVRIGITDDTTPEDMDRYFTQIWRHNRRVVLVFDTTQCDNISLRRALRMKSVLNKHRENSRKFIDHSQILVRSNFTKNILRTALCIIRTERPVVVVKVKT